MPKFKKSALQRGAAAIKESAERSNSGGNFRPFTPEIQWRGDGAEKHVLFLTDIEAIWRLDLHEFIEVGKGKKANGETYVKYEKFLCRHSPAIGEPCRLCDLEDQAKDRCVGIAVELEPIIEEKDDRKRVVGFEVATQEFTRRIKGDDDEIEEVEVTAPIIGIVTQSSSNFYNSLTAFSETHGRPIDEVPFHVKRNGAKRNVNYTFIHFDQPVDLAPLVDNLEGISYLNEEMDTLKSRVDDTESLEDAARVIADALLDHHLDELADSDRFEELTGHITDPIENRFEGNAKKRSGTRRSSAPKRREEPAETVEETPTGSRSDRFRQLKADLEAKKS